MRFMPQLVIAAILIFIALMLQESGAEACEEAGGTVIRNAIGEYTACIGK
jgi:hypothetical protein